MLFLLLKLLRKVTHGFVLANEVKYNKNCEDIMSKCGLDVTLLASTIYFNKLLKETFFLSVGSLPKS